MWGALAGWVARSRWAQYAVLAGAVLLGLFGLSKALEAKGRAQERLRQIRQTAKVQEEMQDANASVDRSRRGLVERLRRRGF